MNIAAQITFIGKLAKAEKTPNILERARFAQVLETLKICRGFIREADDFNPARPAQTTQVYAPPPERTSETIDAGSGVPFVGGPPAPKPSAIAALAAPEAVPTHQRKLGPNTAAAHRAEMENIGALLNTQFQTERPVRTELEQP